MWYLPYFSYTSRTLCFASCVLVLIVVRYWLRCRFELEATLVILWLTSCVRPPQCSTPLVRVRPQEARGVTS